MHAPNHGCVTIVWIEDDGPLADGGLTELDGYLQYNPVIPEDTPEYTGLCLMMSGSPLPLYHGDTMALDMRLEREEMLRRSAT